MSTRISSADIVGANIDRLRAADYPALIEFGKANFNSRSAFAAYKRALKKFEIDYDGLQRAHRDGRAADHAERFAGADELHLVSDAAARHERFAITTPDGTAVWHGRFFDDEGDEQSAAELAAAKKAVWLAGKFATTHDRPIRLVLTVDAEWLTWANESAGGVEAKRGGKAKSLATAARKANIALRVEWTSGATNKADQFTRCRGFQRWQDGLTALAGTLTTSDAAAA